MTDANKVVKAQLWELDDKGNEVEKSCVPVQFNPETLKVSFANQIKTGTEQSTSSGLYVGQGTTKLSVQLWFDVTAPLRPEDKGIKDVRELTRRVVNFITPTKTVQVQNEKGGTDTHHVPPGVRFLWGSFQFDGIMESLEESLEFFSPEGRPLRAGLTLSLTQQKIQFLIKKLDDKDQPPGAPGGKPPGTSPLAEALSGDSLQKLASGMGQAAKWQRIAQANGIENPRRLSPGQLIDMNAPGLR